MLMLVHTKELVEQGAQNISNWNPSLSVGIEMAERRTSGENVVAASVQTLGREDSDRLSSFRPDEFDVICTDEAHHGVGNIYKNVYRHFGLDQPIVPFDLVHAGFTATPNRPDGQAMGQIFDEVVFNYGIQDGIADGWLCDLRGFRIRTSTDLSGVPTSNGDFNQEALGRKVNTEERNNLIAREWIQIAWPRPTIAFCSTVQHAKDLALSFMKNSVPAAAVWGEDPDRKQKLEAFRRGDLKVLCNCQLLTEGFDMWQVSCVIIAGPTKSQAKLIQELGRGTRLQLGIGNLKEWLAKNLLKPGDKLDCIAIDVVDATKHLSCVTLPTLFGLGPKLDLGGASIMAALKSLEGVQTKHPNLNLADLEDFKNLRTYVEEANLWKITFAEEIKEVSKLQWHKNADCSYTLLLPKSERVQVYENALGRWGVLGSIKGSALDDQGFSSMPEALAHAEMNLSLHGRDLMTLLRREATWHKAQITESQMKMLRRFKVPEHLINKMNKGEASKLISSKMGRSKT